MKKTFLRAVALAAVMALSTANMGFAAGGSIGHGNLSVYKEGQLVSKLSGQNPIEDGALLVCDGKCMIKSEGISLIAADNAEVAVTNEADTFKLYVKEGRVDYNITSNTRTIAFYTPQGTYTVAEVVFNAAGQSAVKGYVEVDATGKTEITVTEGRMVFATAEGMKTVDANNRIVLAVTPTGGESALLPLMFSSAAVVGGVGIMAAGTQDDGDGDGGAGGGGGGSTDPEPEVPVGGGGSTGTPASPAL